METKELVKEGVTEATAVKCPFDPADVEAAKAVYLGCPDWMSIYDGAPEGAKARMEVSFFFTVNHNDWTGDEGADEFAKYLKWRTDVERTMTAEDLGYMIAAISKPTAKAHYASLLKDRRSALAGRTSRGMKLMSCADFFAMLGELGEFKSFKYDDMEKKSIISGFDPVLSGSDDPLRTHIEDILETAVLKEVRVYPKDEVMYVRVEVRFLTDTAEWSRPYQMLAAWNGANSLLGYAFPVGKGTGDCLPVELEDPPSKAQRERRLLLMAERVASGAKAQQGTKGVRQ